MMTTTVKPLTPAEYRAAQAAYAARPYLVMMRTSHYSGGHRFDTEGEAFDYIFDQFKRWSGIVADPHRHGYGNSWVAFDVHATLIEYPDGHKVKARDVLFVDHCATS